MKEEEENERHPLPPPTLPLTTAPLLSDDEREMRSAEKEERERVDAGVYVMRGREMLTRPLFCDGTIETLMSVTLPEFTPNRVQVRLCVMVNVRVHSHSLHSLQSLLSLNLDYSNFSLQK